MAWDGDSLHGMVAIEELQFQGRVELRNIRVAPARVRSSRGGTICRMFVIRETVTFNSNVYWRPMTSGISRNVSQGISCNVFKHTVSEIVMLLPSRDHEKG